MKEYSKLGFKVFLRNLGATIMCFFLVISLNVITVGTMSETLGYKAYGTMKDTGKSEILYDYYYADGEDTERAKYEEMGYEISESKIIRVTKGGNIFFLITTQFFCLMLTSAFLYSLLWKEGLKDNNLVRFGHKKADKLKGFKVGLIAAIPHFVFAIALFVMKYLTKTDLSISLIEFLNSPIYSFVRLVLGGESLLDVSLISLIGYTLLGLIIPIVCAICYFIGYKDIYLGDKILYKKKKS